MCRLCDEERMEDTGDHKAAVVASSDVRHTRTVKCQDEQGLVVQPHLREAGANSFEPARSSLTTPSSYRQFMLFFSSTTEHNVDY